MEVSEFVATVEAIHREARRRGLYFQTSEDTVLRDRTIRLGGADLVTFGSCSYLGLEQHPTVVEGVVDAVRRFGTQFAYSRAYLSSPQYLEAEAMLSEILGAPALISLTTALGHQAVLPTLAGERDAIVLDGQVHASVQKAATLAQANGTVVETVRHFELDRYAPEVVARLARTRRTVFVAVDGIYSMYGDCAPVRLLEELLAIAPNVRIYVDDAHGMSWTGAQGRGWFLSKMPLEKWGSRIVFSTSLNKAYSAAGGCFAFADAAERDRVRLTGGSLMFSGPVQPPMLGAIVASAKMHLSGEIAPMQATFRERVAYMNAQLAAHDLPLLSRNESPIFFLRMAKVEAAHTLAERMLAEGYYVNTSTYPMVPLKRAGMRLTVTALHTEAQLRGVCEALAHHLPRVLDEHGISRDELDALYESAIPAESWGGIDLSTAARAARAAERPLGVPATAIAAAPAIRVVGYDSVADVDATAWDALMQGCGTSSAASLAMQERVFCDGDRREHRWQRRYFLALAPDGTLLGATYATRCLVKDDMFMREEVSAAIEGRRRAGEPYCLTSDALVLGAPVSEGRHVGFAPSLDAAARRAVWTALRSAVAAQGDAWGVDAIVVRDFPGDDPEMDAVMLAEDWVKAPLPLSHRLDVDPDESEDGMVARLAAEASRGKRTRKYWRGLREASTAYETRVFGVYGAPAPDGAWCDTLYGLYRSVADRKLRINDFPLPPAFLDGVLASDAWEVLTLHRDPAAGGPTDGAPVAWVAAHRHGTHYAPFICGVDTAHVIGEEFGAYRQLILAILRRARALGMRTIHLGWDAETEKRRVGAEGYPACAYQRHRRHDHGEAMQSLVTRLGLGVHDVVDAEDAPVLAGA